ncbi:MAG: hypothetical protein KGJ34_00435 [Patescibacteria group bacterium]|nr:hypothetical protein [Patescibacteria group bacterium]
MYSHFHHFVQVDGSATTSSLFWGPFLGAFFAFIFGLITFYYTKKREKFVRHRNALIKLERLMHEHADELLIAKIHADDTKKIVEANAVTDYRFKLLRLDTDILMELASIDIINKYNFYSRSITRLNEDFAAKNRALTRFEDAKLANRTLAPESIDYLARSLGEISAAIEGRIDTWMLRLLATTRIYLRKIDGQNRILCTLFCTDWDFTISEDEIQGEIIELNKGVEKMKQETGVNFKKFGTSQ